MSGQTTESTRGAAPNVPGSINGKAGAVLPKVTGDGPVELEDMDGAAETKLPLHEDIMQLARLGEIGPVQKLFEEGKFNAKYRDGEGITPLHVRDLGYLIEGAMLTSDDSGRRLTTIMGYVNTWWSKVLKSTPKAASPSLHQPGGQYRDVTCTSSTYCSRMVRTPSSQTSKAIIFSIWLHLTETFTSSSLYYIRMCQSIPQTCQGIVV